MPEVRSPTVRRRELGALLRALRTEKHLTVEQVAESLLCSSSKVSRMETGQRGATPRDIRDLCDLYGVTDESERDRMMELAREGKRAGWWQSYDLESFGTYVGLEAEAVEIQYYQSTIVPGLLQTPGYARAIHTAAVPRILPPRIEELIEVKLKRQRILSRTEPVRLQVVCDEAALHRVVGGKRVMGAQLNRLVEVAALPNVTVQIIPFGTGAHPAMDSTFNLLYFAGPPHLMVYVEGLMGWFYLQSPQETRKYQQVFEHLRVISLNPKESIEMITKIGARYV